MQIDMTTLPVAQRYKVLTSTVTPRPIAWVVTQDADGLVNAAPYSFFNAMGDDPPMLAIGMLKHHVRTDDKDSATHIRATREFTVNLVCEADAEAMNLSAVDCPRDVSEIDYARITTAPSVKVTPPIVATAPVSFECRLLELVEIGPRQVVVLGEIVMAHVRDEFVMNPDKLYFDTPAMKLIGRTHGSGWYARTSDQFQIDRQGFDPARVTREA